MLTGDKSSKFKLLAVINAAVIVSATDVVVVLQIFGTVRQ